MLVPHRMLRIFITPFLKIQELDSQHKNRLKAIGIQSYIIQLSLDFSLSTWEYFFPFCFCCSLAFLHDIPEMKFSFVQRARWKRRETAQDETYLVKQKRLSHHNHVRIGNQIQLHIKAILLEVLATGQVNGTDMKQVCLAISVKTIVYKIDLIFFFTALYIFKQCY